MIIENRLWDGTINCRTVTESCAGPSYEVKSFATDVTRNNVAAYGVFHATHTGPGGPVPPTGRSTSTDCVYVMQFDDGKIVPMTKIWNAGVALKDLGWA